MNLLSTKWVFDQEMEEFSIIHMNSIVEEIHEAQYSLPHSFSTNSDLSNDDLIEGMKPSKILKPTYILPNLPPPPPPLSSSPTLPPNSKPPLPHQPSSRINQKGTKRAQPLYRSLTNAQEHKIAEKERRDKLTQRLVALSALVPGLKKMDKASVLGDAIKHIKYLQERVKEFEEEKKKETCLEPIVLVKKSKVILDDNNHSSSSFSFSSYCVEASSGLDLPEIEVRVTDKDVLIKILCEKQKGHIAKIMAEIEKFRFTITKSCVLPFGPTLDITIIAQKESDFDMTLIDVVKNLRSGLSKFM